MKRSWYYIFNSKILSSNKYPIITSKNFILKILLDKVSFLRKISSDLPSILYIYKIKMKIPIWANGKPFAHILTIKKDRFPSIPTYARSRNIDFTLQEPKYSCITIQLYKFDSGELVRHLHIMSRWILS